MTAIEDLLKRVEDLERHNAVIAESMAELCGEYHVNWAIKWGPKLREVAAEIKES